MVKKIEKKLSCICTLPSVKGLEFKKDPFTNEDFIVKTHNNFLFVYSRGPDGNDENFWKDGKGWDIMLLNGKKTMKDYNMEKKESPLYFEKETW